MVFPASIESGSVSDTENAGKMLGEYLLSAGENDAFIALYGDLGAGKTAFVRGLAEVLTPGAPVCSPTYTVVNEYRGKSGRRLCHFDMYRIADDDDLYSIGFYDYSGCVMAAEWCEKIPFALPDDYFRVTIRKTGENDRKRTIERIRGTLRETF